MGREWFEQLAFAIIGGPAVGRQFGSREIARASSIEPKEVVAVDPLEIEQQRQCLTYFNVGKGGPPGVENQEFGRLRHAGLDGVADHLAIAGGGKVISFVPAQRLGFDAEIIKSALEGFELAIGLAIEIEPDLVKVPQAAIDRQIAAPIVGIACQRDAGAGLDRSDAVGAGTDRSGRRGFFKRSDVRGMPRQYRHQTKD